ncbi:hypothetical protein ABW20_dc0102437 [Dactylellina cionopaga]|nr:hypothetical protein ABW20_dc0102437 [Dactylellina cionopaga]
MDLTSASYPATLDATAVYFPSLHYDNSDDHTHVEDDLGSYLRLQNQPPVSDDGKKTGWQVHGVSYGGNRLSCLPESAIGKPPLRIDIYVLEPSDMRLWRALDFGSLRKPCSLDSLRKLPCAQHIIKALEFWSDQYPPGVFEKRYFNMPFGSCIYIENVARDIRRFDIQFVANYELERDWCTLNELQDAWKHEVPADQWPEVVQVNDLQLIKQPHDAISLVSLPGKRDPSELFVFKSVTKDIKYMYHELRLLLSMEPHESILSAPLYIVTARARFGGKIGVCGFVMNYFPMGSLRGALSSGKIMQSSEIQDIFRMARQITSAVIQVNSTKADFYSDLKPDNVLLSLDSNNQINATLIDFEQRGSWYGWSPPEVHYIEYLETLACHRLVPKDAREEYSKLLKDCYPSWKPLIDTDRYDSIANHHNFPWRVLSKEQRERAQVYMLGKMLWCLFESKKSET